MIQTYILTVIIFKPFCFIDAAEVLSKECHTVNKQPCTVKPYVEETTTPDVENRLIVTGVKDPLSLDILELWLESSKNGGGPITNIFQDPSSKTVTVDFENAERK